MKMETTDWLHICPECGRTNEAASGPGSPDDGDCLICWSCHEISVAVVTPYGLQARTPTATELQEMRADPQVRATLAAMAESFTPSQAARMLERE
jgi:hypothetical protein